MYIKAHNKASAHIDAQCFIDAVREITGLYLDSDWSKYQVVVSLETGSWRESAILKLESAGINYSSIPLASSDDHYSRIEIMKLAAERASRNHYPCTYFVDGVWDNQACSHLGYNCVLVGVKFSHNPSIPNFQSLPSALSCVGL